MSCKNSICKKSKNLDEERRSNTSYQSLTELTESYKDLYCGIKGTSREVAATKKLWREGNKSKLIKIGVACIMFLDPFPIGEIIGAGFIAE